MEVVLFETVFTPVNSCLPRQAHHLKKQNDLKINKKKKFMLTASASSTPFTSASSKKKEFSPCPLLPPLGLCRPLLAQASTTPHTEAHRHRGRRSCAWSLETYRSRREPWSKGLFFMIFPFPQFGFRIILVFLFSGFMGSVQLCWGFWVLELEFKGSGYC